jgi:raffinose/stachyose/melibiose transport system permease protein
VDRSLRLWIPIYLLPATVMFLLIFSFPIVMVVFSSFTEWNGISPMVGVGFKNYAKLFTEDPSFLSAIGNTLVWAALQTFVHVPFGILVAIILNRKPKGWRFVRSVFMIPNIVSAAAMALIFTFVFSPDSGLLNGIIRTLGNPDFAVNWFFDDRTAFASVTAMWLFYAAVIVLITMAQLSSVPESVREAAFMDGASAFQVDWYIHLPLVKSIIGYGMIIAMASAFGNFNLIFMTTKGGPGDATTNLPLLVYLNTSVYRHYGYANAISTVLMVLGAGSMMALNRWFKLNNPGKE